jgi:hypothetical protein
MTRIAIAAAAATIALTLPAPAGAQWLNLKTPGIPRTPDGKPILSGPAPKTADGKPDLSGLWRSDPTGSAETSKALDTLKPLPWAAALTEKRKENFGSEAPGVLCLPPGPVVGMGVGKIVQTPNLIVMLWGGTLYREIFLDGRQLSEDPNPDWMGYSVGHWEGDTLVIVSTGFNDKTWLDGDGHPHTEALRVTERIRRPDFGHVEVTRTLVDPGAFKDSWTVPLKLELDPDREEFEYVCNENEKDRQHLVGKASDEKSVKVAPEILSKYTGSYELKSPTTGRIFNFTIGVTEDRLVMSGLGPSTPLTSVSNTDFSSPAGNLKFVLNDDGALSYLILQAVEGDIKAYRK